MKIIALLCVSLILGFVILALAEWLGFDTKAPRGWVLFCILDLAVLKAYVFFLAMKEMFK